MNADGSVYPPIDSAIFIDSGSIPRAATATSAQVQTDSIPGFRVVHPVRSHPQR